MPEDGAAGGRASPVVSQASDEASAEGLRLAREAGDAYQRMVQYFLKNIAKGGCIREIDDYRIGVAVEAAEPLWMPCGENLALREPPTQANQHLEVVVTDRGDGRFIPELYVTATLDEHGKAIGSWHMPFLWHPTMYHYGANVTIPRSGTYRLRVSIARPLFSRHDKVNGRRYERPVVVDFGDLRLEAARESR